MFKRYIPVPPPEIPAAYFKNEDGVDWYSIVHDAERAELSVYVGTDESGQVTSVAYDGSSMYPDGKTVYEVPISEFPEWVPDKEMYTSIVNNKFVFDHEKLNADTQYRSISKARKFSQDWRTELELGMISDGDKEKLSEVMAYIKQLREVDTTESEPIWPQIPSFMNQ